jgi:hypothetical protein
MSRRFSSVLFITVLLAAVVLWSNCWAYVDVADGTCGSDKAARGQCIEAAGYVIEILPDSNGNWPIVTTGTHKDFAYRVTLTTATAPLDSLSLVLPVCASPIGDPSTYILGSNPPGIGPVTLNCPPASGKAMEIPLPSPQPTSWDFHLFTKADLPPAVNPGTDCHEMMVVTGSCAMGAIKGPGCPATVSGLSSYEFASSQGKTLVSYDECSGLADSVVDPATNPATPFNSLSTPLYICYGNPYNSQPICEQIQSVGDPKGAVLEAGTAPDYFFDHGSAWKR